MGAGSWGTAFARLLADRGHAVTLAARDPEQARAMAETGRNPRYLTGVPLNGVESTTIADAPIAAADVVVLAVPSAAFAGVAHALPGSAPVLSLTKGLDPGSGERLSTLVRDRSVAVLSGPTSPRRSARAFRPQPSSRARTRPWPRSSSTRPTRSSSGCT